MFKFAVMAVTSALLFGCTGADFAIGEASDDTGVADTRSSETDNDTGKLDAGAEAAPDTAPDPDTAVPPPDSGIAPDTTPTPDTGTLEGGSDAPDTATTCTPGATQCSGRTVQTCKPDGTGWLDSFSCGFACIPPSGTTAATCGGSCVPDALRCTGAPAPGPGVHQEKCNAVGEWETAATCPYLCSDTSGCYGECIPGSSTSGKRCSGDQPQMCDSTAKWVNKGGTCNFGCSSGDCACTAVLSGRFTNPTPNVVFDGTTGRLWQKATGPSVYNWTDANAYCGGLVIDGSSGFRLPSKAELAALLAQNAVSSCGAIDTDTFAFAAKPQKYWTYSVDPGVSGNLWTVHFGTGEILSTPSTDGLYVRCVR